MKTYELTYIVSPEITSEEAEAKGKEIESLISAREGTILKQSKPIAKTFSYPIGKKASGFFGVLEFQLEPEKLLELKEIVSKDGNIVRNMITIKEAAEFKKERRTKSKADSALNSGEKAEVKIQEKGLPSAELSEEKETPVAKKEVKEKVELKDIEHELDELLGE